MSLTPLFAIAHQTIRQAIRSRLVVTLLLLAALLVWVMPLILRDDGTHEGRFRVLLAYTLNGTFVLLVTAALWSACAAVSTDLATRRLHLVIVKPVGAFNLWFGQWLGLVTLYGSLLLLVWVATLGQLLHQNTAPREEQTHAWSAGVDMTTARVIRPQPAPASAVAGDPETYFRLSPGQNRTVQFRLPRRRHPDKTAVLELHFVTSLDHETSMPVDVPLAIDIGGSTLDSRTRITERFRAGTRYRIEAISLTDFDGDNLHVAIHNHGLHPPVTLLIHRHEGLKLRFPQSGLIRNHLRGAAIMLARLGFFIAVGLTAGTLFSFPVAAFAGGFWLLFAALAGYIRSVTTTGFMTEHHHGTPTVMDPSMVDHALLAVFRVFDTVLSPLRMPPTIQRLESNNLISLAEVATAFGVLWILYTGLLAIMGITALRRRELGQA